MRLSLSILVLACAAHAQLPVSPAQYASQPAPFGIDMPMSGQGYVGVLQIHDDMAGRPAIIRGLAFRTVDGRSVRASSAWCASAFCSTAKTTAATASLEPMENHGSDFELVLYAKTIWFPASSEIPGGVEFTHVIPFDTPFAFGGAGPLCWDIGIGSRTAPPGLYWAGVASEDPDPPLRQLEVGVGCLPTGGSSPMHLAVSGPFSWLATMGQLDAGITSGPPGASGFLTVGGANRVSGHIPLPWQVPGTAGAPSGLCTVYSNVAAAVPITLDATGGASLSFPLAVTSKLAGLSLFWQSYAFDAAANPWGVITSNGWYTGFVAPYGLQGVTQIAGNSLTGFFTMRKNAGAVVEFQ